jgi:diguanylate cyclase (GGDEF)-like protein
VTTRPAVLPGTPTSRSTLHLAFELGSGLHSPFDHEGLGPRALPFAFVAVLATASISLPPGPTSAPEALGAIGLLALVASAFLLPWTRIPAPFTVLVPVAYAGSVMLLTLSAGTTVTGIGIVLLMPVVWTALYHRAWESVAVVAATAGIQLVTSFIPVELHGDVIARKVAFWVLLSGLVALATHLLRSRLQRDSAVRETLLRQTAALVSASAELTSILEADEVIATGTRLAAELTSPSGTPGRRAQYVRVDAGTVHLAAELDETGGQGGSFPLEQHPYLAQVVRDRTAWGGVLDPAVTGPLVREMVELLGLAYSIYVPVIVDDELDGVLAVSMRATTLPPGLVEQCEALGHIMELALSNARANASLLKRATTDALTKLPNRHAFDGFVANRPGRLPFAILALDLDNLKEVNDAAGHAAGDALLTLVADTVTAVLRRGDVLARIGGDEFAAFLFEASEEDGCRAAERVLAALQAVSVRANASVSIGVASGTPDDDAALVQAAADTAMYEAKRAGGGRYRVASAPTAGSALQS